jgi:large subunit ribosomal protein L19e
MFARLSPKKNWMTLVRKQRAFIKELRGKGLIDIKGYREVYTKIKGGYFRNVRHIKLYLTEHKLFTEKKK